MDRKETPFIDLIKEAWPFYKSNLVVTIGIPVFLMYAPLAVVGIPACIISVIVCVITGFVLGKTAAQASLMLCGIIAALVFAAAYNTVRAGWINCMLRMMRGQSRSFMDVKSGTPWAINLFLTMLIIGVATAAGSFCFILPGIIIAVRTLLAPYLVIDENLGPIDALKRSNELVSGYSWQILLYILLFGFTNIVAAFIPVVGAPVAMGFFDLVLARIYFYRIGEDVEMPGAASSTS